MPSPCLYHICLPQWTDYCTQGELICKRLFRLQKTEIEKETFFQRRLLNFWWWFSFRGAVTSHRVIQIIPERVRLSLSPRTAAAVMIIRTWKKSNYPCLDDFSTETHPRCSLSCTYYASHFCLTCLSPSLSFSSLPQIMRNFRYGGWEGA